MSNIIPFPKENKRLPLLDLQKRINDSNLDGVSRTGLCIETVGALSLILIEHLQYMGMDTSKPEHIHELALALESLKSYILAYNNIHHPVQKISRDVFNVKNGVIFLNQNRINQMFFE